MKLPIVIVMMGGLLLLAGLLVRVGITAIGDALVTVGGWGFVWISLAHLPSLVLCGLAWFQVCPSEVRLSTLGVVMSRWIRDGINNVFAFLPISGELVGIRLFTRQGLPGSTATAVLVVDMTMELVSQYGFTLLGLGLLYYAKPDHPLVSWSALGILLSAPLLVGVIYFQKAGLFVLLERCSNLVANTLPLPAILPDSLNRLQRQLHQIYTDPQSVRWACCLHLAAWIAGVLETWLGLRYLGHPLPFWQVVILDSLVFAFRTIAFFVPSAIGIQEGGYLAIGELFDLASPLALSVSLLKRGRELVFGCVGLLVWAIWEGASVQKQQKTALESE